MDMFATGPTSPGTMTESLHMTGAEIGRCAWAGVNRRRRRASGADGRRLRLVLVVVVVVVVTIVSSLQTHVQKLILTHSRVSPLLVSHCEVINKRIKRGQEKREAIKRHATTDKPDGHHTTSNHKKVFSRKTFVMM